MPLMIVFSHHFFYRRVRTGSTRCARGDALFFCILPRLSHRCFLHLSIFASSIQPSQQRPSQRVAPVQAAAARATTQFSNTAAATAAVKAEMQCVPKTYGSSRLVTLYGKSLEELGLTLEQEWRGCVVSAVAAGSPAELSGLVLQHDVVVSVNGQPVLLNAAEATKALSKALSRGHVTLRLAEEKILCPAMHEASLASTTYVQQALQHALGDGQGTCVGCGQNQQQQNHQPQFGHQMAGRRSTKTSNMAPEGREDLPEGHYACLLCSWSLCLSCASSLPHVEAGGCVYNMRASSVERALDLWRKEVAELDTSMKRTSPVVSTGGFAFGSSGATAQNTAPGAAGALHSPDTALGGPTAAGTAQRSMETATFGGGFGSSRPMTFGDIHNRTFWTNHKTHKILELLLQEPATRGHWEQFMVPAFFQRELQLDHMFQVASAAVDGRSCVHLMQFSVFPLIYRLLTNDLRLRSFSIGPGGGRDALRTPRDGKFATFPSKRPENVREARTFATLLLQCAPDRFFKSPLTTLLQHMTRSSSLCQVMPPLSNTTFASRSFLPGGNNGGQQRDFSGSYATRRENLPALDTVVRASLQQWALWQSSASKTLEKTGMEAVPLAAETPAVLSAAETNMVPVASSGGGSAADTATAPPALPTPTLVLPSSHPTVSAAPTKGFALVPPAAQTYSFATRASFYVPPEKPWPAPPLAETFATVLPETSKRVWLLPQVSDMKCDARALLPCEDVPLLPFSAEDANVLARQPLAPVDLARFVVHKSHLESGQPPMETRMPFDLSHHDQAKSRPSRTLLARLEGDVALHAELVNTSSVPILRCLQDSAVAEIAQSTAAAQVSERICGTERKEDRKTT